MASDRPVYREHIMDTWRAKHVWSAVNRAPHDGRWIIAVNRDAPDQRAIIRWDPKRAGDLRPWHAASCHWHAPPLASTAIRPTRSRTGCNFRTARPPRTGCQRSTSEERTMADEAPRALHLQVEPCEEDPTRYHWSVRERGHIPAAVPVLAS